MSLDVHSHRTQLVLTALAASAATAGALSAYNTFSRQKKRRELADDVTRSVANATGSRADADAVREREQDDGIRLKGFDGEGSGARTPDDALAYDEELIREQLARNYAFFGEEGMEKLRKGSVVVVGCGGVGSWAAVMLVRSGISKIRLVDFDYVTLSSLNRHATAALKDVGTPKVQCVARALKSFARWVEVEPCVDLWRKEDGGRLLEGVDWVIDAIDNISTKVELLKYCHDNGIKVFSSMGAGAKSDPTRIQIADISNTVYDPLARSVRRRLKLVGVTANIPVVYSTEVPSDVKLIPLSEEEFQKGNVQELGVFDNFRVRILPVLGPLPATFGLHIASYVLCALAGKPLERPLPIKGRWKLYEKLLKDFAARESRITGDAEMGNTLKLPIDHDDVAYIFDDLHVGRSLIPPHGVPTRPALVRWDPAQPIQLENVVVMEYGDAERHLREVFGVGKRKPKSKKQILSGAVTESPGPMVMYDSPAAMSRADSPSPPRELLRPDAPRHLSVPGSGLSMSSASVEFVTPNEEFSTPSSELAEEPAEVRMQGGRVVIVPGGDAALEEVDRRLDGEEEGTSGGRRPVEVWGEEVAGIVERRRRDVERYREWVLKT